MAVLIVEGNVLAPSVPILPGDSSGSSLSILRKKRLAASRSRFAVSKKSTGFPCLSMARYRYRYRCIGEDPAVDCTMVDLEAALAEHLLEISVAERIP